MLKKLIKHEWAETWKIPVLAFSTALVLTVACALYFYFAPAPPPNVELNVGHFMLFLLYVLYVSFISLLLLVFLGVRFYKNMFTDEGYLMHTLPVPPWMLILSKTLVSLFWVYLAGIFTVISVLPVSLLAVPKLAYFTEAELAEIAESIPEVVALFGGNFWEILFYFLPCMLASSLFSVLLLYAAICLGQLFGKHKALSSVLCYLGLNALLSTAAGLLGTILMFPGLTGIFITHADDGENFLSLTVPALLRTTYIVSFFSNLLLSAACFMLCSYLMKKSLNLD